MSDKPMIIEDKVMSEMEKITLNGYRCKRCNHKWVPRGTNEGIPITCPGCKSPYWNKQRRHKK